MHSSFYNQANFDRSSLNRVIGRFEGRLSGPTMVLIGGIHGNESAGVWAIQRLFEQLDRYQVPMRGRIIGVVGNLAAVKRDVRYIDHDLNRLWLPAVLQGAQFMEIAETNEFFELNELLDELMSSNEGPLTFVDLHSFSAEGCPFSISASHEFNRHLVAGLALPVVFGLDQYLEGTLVHYVESLGHHALAFEGGRHEDPATTGHMLAFLWEVLVRAGALIQEEVPAEIEPLWQQLLARTRTFPNLVRIKHRHLINPGDAFKMHLGYHNFDPIRKGVALAEDRHGIIESPADGFILMPLYQGQGNDGFFIAEAELPEPCLQVVPLAESILKVT